MMLEKGEQSNWAKGFSSFAFCQKVIEALAGSAVIECRYAFEVVLLSLLKHSRLTIELDDLVCLLRPTLSKNERYVFLPA
jgi:hypothetical protein